MISLANRRKKLWMKSNILPFEVQYFWTKWEDFRSLIFNLKIQLNSKSNTTLYFVKMGNNRQRMWILSSFCIQHFASEMHTQKKLLNQIYTTRPPPSKKEIVEAKSSHNCWYFLWIAQSIKRGTLQKEKSLGSQSKTRNRIIQLRPKRIERLKNECKMRTSILSAKMRAVGSWAWERIIEWPEALLFYSWPQKKSTTM